jgi:DNA repair exonuclease SbcCD ATPase subunit
VTRLPPHELLKMTSRASLVRLRNRRARRRTIGIFEGSTPGEACPLCLQPLTESAELPSVSQVHAALTTVSVRLDSVTRTAPQMERAVAELEQNLVSVQRNLAQNRSEMEAVRAINEGLAQAQDETTKRAHVLGRISLYLESLPELPDSTALEAQRENLRTQ